MFSAYMWCYLWDALDEGIDQTLDRMQEAGVGGVCIATIYHSIEHLRMHAALGAGPRAYRQAGAAYFQPDADKYANTRLRPVVAEWLKSRNPLVDLGKACGEREMAMRSWTVCCHSSEMVRRRPEIGIKTAFGDVNPTWMCPLNADVGEYLRAAVEDLSSNYPFEAIELESPGFNVARHYHTHIKMGLQPGPLEQFLLSLCFCESCRQGALSADVDVEQAVGSVRDGLARWFADAQPSGETVEELLGRDAAVRSFVQWRTRWLSETIRKMRSTCRCKLVVYADRDIAGSGFDLADVASEIDGAVGCCYSPETELIDRTVGWLSGVMAGTNRLSVGLMTYPPGSPDAPTLVRHVHRVSELGVPSVHLYHYGIMPDACLTWTKQALRKPRREA